MSCSSARGKCDSSLFPYRVALFALLPKGSVVAPMPSERLYDENAAVIPYKRIVAPMLSEGLYGGIGEKSIGYPRKVYRVFPESL